MGCRSDASIFPNFFEEKMYVCLCDAIFRQQLSEKASRAASTRQGPTRFRAPAIHGGCDLRTSTLLMRGSFFLVSNLMLHARFVGQSAPRTSKPGSLNP